MKKSNVSSDRRIKTLEEENTQLNSIIENLRVELSNKIKEEEERSIQHEKEKGKQKDLNKVNTVIKTISFSNEQNNRGVTLNSAITNKDQNHNQRYSTNNLLVVEDKNKKRNHSQSHVSSGSSRIRIEDLTTNAAQNRSDGDI